MIRYPDGLIVPHGSYHLIKGEHPSVWLDAYDGSVRFDMMGGKAIPDRTRPETVQIKRGGIKNLVSPWTAIKQKGATQDGSTFVDALNEVGDPELTVVAKGRDGKHTRRVVRDLIASLDKKQVSQLNWFTNELGHWWTGVRWDKPFAEPYIGAQQKRQELSLRLAAYDSFWRSYDDVDSFTFAYETMTDTFDTDYGDDLGPNWPQLYTGDGGGLCFADGDDAVWADDPDVTFFTDTREVVNGPYKDFETDTDNQVINLVFGSFQEWSFPDSGADDIWGRMGRDMDGAWDGNGIRLRLEGPLIRLSRFNDFTETVLRDNWGIGIAPFPGEKFSLVCGYEDDPRLFKVLRNGSEVMAHKEIGTASEMGTGFRGVGFGMLAGAALITQATPANVRKISAGDNSSITQTGHLTRINVGDQPMFDRYTCFGPGVFAFGNGPGATDYVQFGPLLPNQIMHLRTDPRKRKVVDLTSVPPTQQELDLFQQGLKDFISFATGNNIPPLLQAIESVFGIQPPQGNPYSLLQGRWSDAAAIPAKSPGSPAPNYHVTVSISGGNADSKIIAAGTPLRRWPI